MRPRSNDLHVGAAITTGRRFLPPLTAVPVVIGEEPWRERPRLRAMNLCRARSRVVHATVPGVHLGVLAACPHEASLRVQNVVQISHTIASRGLTRCPSCRMSSRRCARRCDRSRRTASSHARASWAGCSAASHPTRRCRSAGRADTDTKSVAPSNFWPVFAVR